MIFLLMTTIDLIDVFCSQSIIGIDPIDVFLTIGAQLCALVSVTYIYSLLLPLRTNQLREPGKYAVNLRDSLRRWALGPFNSPVNQPVKDLL
jgi:hypothetical protein